MRIKGKKQQFRSDGANCHSRSGNHDVLAENSFLKPTNDEAGYRSAYNGAAISTQMRWRRGTCSGEHPGKTTGTGAFIRAKKLGRKQGDRQYDIWPTSSNPDGVCKNALKRRREYQQEH